MGVGPWWAMAMVDADADRELELAAEAMATFDAESAAMHLSAAIRALTAAGDCRRAALVCAQLGDLYANAMGNGTAARAWFVRATRLIDDEPPCVEQGWVAVAAMGCDVDDPAVLLQRAQLALDRARQFGDVNLETKALADAGLACVQARRVAEGMAMLDEAMALACGPADNLDSAGRSVCSFFTACYFAADFDRVDSWADTLRRRGLIGKAEGPTLFLSSHCDAVQATALCELGRWGDAEAMLLGAIDAFEAGMGMPSWHPAIALAELRIRQGRLADAEMLLLGKDGSMQALLPAAHLHLARGDLDLARATATRGLRAIGDDRLRAADLLAVLVDTELAAGDLAAADAACNDLEHRAVGLEVSGLQAKVAALRARVLAAGGGNAQAIGTMEAALDRLPPSGVPLLRATLLIELVRLHDHAGNRAAATVEAGRATAALAGLDVVVRPADVALLERAVRPGNVPSPRRATLSHEDRSWVVSFGDLRCRLPETKGLLYVAELVGNAGVERHALDLVDRVEGVAAGELAVDRRSLGDAGEVVDSKARTAYRHRIEALRGEIDDAFDSGAEDRAQQLQAELDQLVAHLAQAFGLGGRSRRASSTVERARLNVTRAIRAATARVTEALPDAGPVLDHRLRTGIYCAYEPAETDDVRWSVQS